MDSSEKALKIIIRNSDGTSNDVTMYSVDGKLPTTIEIGGVLSAKEVTVFETEIIDDDPSTLVDSPKDDLEGQAPARKTNWLRIYFTIQQALTALFSLTTAIIMIMTLVKFFSTSHIAGAWPTNPKLYPTYTLLIVSLISLCIDLLHLGAQYCGSASARKADLMVSKLRYTVLVIQAIASATGTGVFNGTKNAGSGQDLFGWTCSDAADQFATVNSSDLVCQSNTSSKIISILQTSLHVLGIIITFVGMFGPKDTNVPDAKPGKGDEASAPKTKRYGWKPSDAKKPSDDSKPDDNAEPSGDNAKPEEPQLDTEALTSLVKKSQALYTQLSGGDQTDFGQYGESDQTRYADIDINSEAHYDGHAEFPMTSFNLL